MTKVTFDQDKFFTAAKKMATGVFKEVAELQQSFLTEEKRTGYPRKTYRRVGRGITGKIADAVRDVVDTGELVDSWKYGSTDNGNSLKYHSKWTSPHSQLVRGGWKKGKTVVPPYDWLKKADIEMNYPESFKREWEEQKST